MRLPRYTRIGFESASFVAYYYLIDPRLWAFGVSVDLRSPNVEIHLGPGFFRVGWRSDGHLPSVRGMRPSFGIERRG